MLGPKMKRLPISFFVVTVVLVSFATIIKSKYYYLPFSNLSEYFLAPALISYTIVLIFWKRGKSFQTILFAGVLSIIVLIGMVNLLNWKFKWHPANSIPSYSKSQSFQAGYEPFNWETEIPIKFGYNNSLLSSYFNKLEQWNRLRALLVVKKDKLIIERYFSGATKHSAFNVHSITKSITSTLVGLAIQNEYIKSEDELILPFFPEYQNIPYGAYKKSLTLKHLLSMRGGWSGGDGFQTVKECITNEYLSVMPDTEFKYFTGSQNILSAIVSKNTKKPTKEFAEEFLFQPLGINNGFWRTVDGYYLGGDESYYTARDLARFGQLFLNRGKLDGRQLLDSVWVTKSLANYTYSSNEFRSLDCYDEIGYGYGWWILKNKQGGIMYSARGKGGQHVILIPEKNIVVVIIQEWNPFIKDERIETSLLRELLSIL